MIFVYICNYYNINDLWSDVSFTRVMVILEFSINLPFSHQAMSASKYSSLM